MEARVIRLDGPRDLTFASEMLNEDALLGKQLLGRTLYSAISPGTEVAAYRGAPGLRPGNRYPRVVGYCNVAEVLKTGPGVSAFGPGDTILTFQSHRSAFVCTEDEVILRVPPGADLPRVSTTYLFHLGYNALLDGGFRPGHNVAVVGLGTLGLATVAVATSVGARVHAFSNQAHALRFAREFGARSADRKDSEDGSGRVFEATGGTGIDIVVDTSNAWADWRLSLELARRGGVVVSLGFPGRDGTLPEFNPLDSAFFYDKQLRLIATGYTPDLDVPPEDVRFTIRRNCHFLLELILEERLPAGRLISSVVDYCEIEAIYRTLLDRAEPFVTAVLRWEGVAHS